MKQVLQNLGSGQTEIIDTPCPQIKPGHILIKTKVSLISTGTEKMAITDSKTSVVKKVIQQPKKLQKAWSLYKQEGFETTMKAINKQFDFPITMGYSNVGVVIGMGQGVSEFKIGDRVLSNGPHAEVVNVPKNLCAKIPDAVSDKTAAFTVLSSIGLQGVRLMNPTLGETIAVIGLGVIGLLTVQILKANGCHVIAIDLDSERVDLAKKYGALPVYLNQGDDPVAIAKQQSEHYGIDGVIITAATKSNSPIEQAAQMCRKRGRIVLTGVVGLNIDRNLFYEKELTFQVSCSYGPGRYDKTYELNGNDYPLPFVRWTEKRNFQACLELMNNKNLDCQDFLNKTYDIEKIAEAYEEIHSDNPPLTVLINYPSNKDIKNTIVHLTEAPKLDSSQASIAVIGTGNYSQNMIIPVLQKTKAHIRSLVSQGGLSSTLLAKKLNIPQTTTEIEQVLQDATINTVVIATRHNTHSDIICKAIHHNKNIFVEKPLCIDEIGFEKIKSNSKNQVKLLVGYNRRFAPLTKMVQKDIGKSKQPRFIQMNINAGYIPEDHWVQSSDEGGGRLIGEACHFIDLARFFADSKISHIKAYALKNCGVTDENISITIQFKNGSLASINYFANGSKFMEKEYIQVSHQGTVYQIHDFKTLHTYSPKSKKVKKLNKQDKGQFNLFTSFLKHIELDEPAPISLEEIFEVADATLKARKSLS